MRAQIGEQCVINANEQFWDQMLSMNVEAVAGLSKFRAAAGHLPGSVVLSGVWTGRVEVRMEGASAREAMAAMMMQPVEQVAEADTVEATKEIANIIAGVIKSCLPRPCNMRVPEAAVETKDCVSEAAPEDVIELVFGHETGDRLVRVWEQECLEAAAAEQAAGVSRVTRYRGREWARFSRRQPRFSLL